jgi:hypothetical protein
MRIFLTTCVLFGLGFVLHVIVWKTRLPRDHSKALLFVFGIVFAPWLVFALFRSVPIFDLLDICLFYVSASLCYIVLYSAVEVDSPTLVLMRFLSEAGTAGRSTGEVADFFARRPFVQARVNALLLSGHIREEAGRYVLAGEAPAGFRFIRAFRKLYGPIPLGG